MYICLCCFPYGIYPKNNKIKERPERAHGHMNAINKTAQIKSPATYDEWQDCFDLLKQVPSIDHDAVMKIAKGSFISRGYMGTQFQLQLAETINKMLSNRTTRFMKDLNSLISINEILDTVPLFNHLRDEFNKCLFFTELKFLEKNYKRDLEKSVRTQMQKFWNDTVMFLQRQTQQYRNTDLEDALFLIHRIELFPKV